METSSASDDIKSTGAFIGLSYILFGISLLLQLSPKTDTVSLLVGILAIIIFLTQRKYLKKDIKLYVYASIIIYIIMVLILLLYLDSLIYSFNGFTSNGINGTAFYGLLINIIIVVIVGYIIHLITYIMTSVKFLLNKMKYLFTGILVIGTISNIVYVILFLIAIKPETVSKVVSLSAIHVYENRINYLFLGSPLLILRLIGSLLFGGPFIFLGLYINKHIKSYMNIEKITENLES